MTLTLRHTLYTAALAAAAIFMLSSCSARTLSFDEARKEYDPDTDGYNYYDDYDDYYYDYMGY